MTKKLMTALFISGLSFASASSVIAMGDKPAESSAAPDKYAQLIDQPLSLGEQFTLRTYTGQAVGLALSKQLGIKSLNIVQNTSSICTSLAAGIGAEAVAHNRANNVYLTLAVKDAADVSAQATRFTDKAAVALVFGGQTPPAENYALAKATLSSLAEANYDGAIFYHLAVWAPKLIERIAAEDSAINDYLLQKTNMYAVTINAQEGQMLIHQIALQDNGQQASVKVIHQEAMNDSWLNLFKRSSVKRN